MAEWVDFAAVARSRLTLPRVPVEKCLSVLWTYPTTRNLTNSQARKSVNCSRFSMSQSFDRAHKK